MREKNDDNQIDLFTGDAFIYRSILTSDWQSTEKEVIEYYNQRGSSECIRWYALIIGDDYQGIKQMNLIDFLLLEL